MDIVKQTVLKINRTFCFNLYCPYLEPGGDNMEAKWSRLRDLREDHDLTQKQVAKILNCSQQVYSNYELGQRDIPTAILIKLADYYNVTTDYILGRK